MIANELFKNIRKKLLITIAKEYFINKNLLGGTLEKLIGEVEFKQLADNAGKIDTIKVNGSALTITDKEVNIDLT